MSDTADVVIVGAGAAGLAAAAFCAAATQGRRIVCVDGARTIGAKILVSGGTRCNVTNRVVSERDFAGGDARLIRSVLRAFPAKRTVDFFQGIGVALREEAGGKLFPETNSARTVLQALLGTLQRTGVELRASTRVTAIARSAGRFVLEAEGHRELSAGLLVLATGGRSLPKTGSDGAGYGFARGLGHGYVETTPALVPLLLDDGVHQRLSGVAHAAALTLRSAGASRRLNGSILWTHFGASGPLVLDASRHWLRSRLSGEEVEATLNVVPDETFESLESWCRDMTRDRPRSSLRTALAAKLPASVAEAWIGGAALDPGTTMAHLSKEDRRRLIRALVQAPLAIRESRGYNYAEVTAGGIPLAEIDSATMESRRCPGLYLIGEMLDVDGRLGGFNFQWAWSSAWVAAAAITRRLAAWPTPTDDDGSARR